jgi:hypothetical protein
MSSGHPLTDEQVAYICEHYKDTTNYVLADELGVSRSAVCRVAMAYHLKKTPEHYSAMGRKAGMASSESRGGACFGVYTPEVIARRAESFRKTFHEDQVRWKWGLPTKTRLRVKKQPKAKCNQRAYLKHLGYILDDDNNVAYYTNTTHRATRMEAYTTKRKYYKFKPYNEYESECQ